MCAGISMRELDPKSPHALPACSVLGAGRLGTVLAAALSDAPALRRGEPVPQTAEVVLLCVPDGKIAEVARHASRRVRCSATAPAPPGLDVFGAREGFSLHPLMSVPTGSEPSVLRGAGAAIDGTTERALNVAATLAGALGMLATRVAAEDRAAYHAAGAIAANFLVALEACAERLAATTGHHPRAARPARAGHRRAVGAARARGRADGRDRARRRGHGRAPSRRDRRAHPGAPAGLDRAGRGHPGRGG